MHVYIYIYMRHCVKGSGYCVTESEEGTFNSECCLSLFFLFSWMRQQTKPCDVMGWEGKGRKGRDVMSCHDKHDLTTRV
jgi:hypothetical protein